MTRTFVTTSVFNKRWEELGLADDDLRELEIYLMENPSSGDVIRGTGGAIKLRWRLPNMGKSSGIRIIYIDIIIAKQVHLLTCYSKSKKDNLTESEKQSIKTIAKRIIKNERAE